MDQTVLSTLVVTGVILVVIFLWYMGLSITLRILERKMAGRAPKVRAPKIRAQKSSAPQERMITHMERLAFLEQRVQRLEDERRAS